MTFHPDLDDLSRLSRDAPFPEAMQGEWMWPETGEVALTIDGRAMSAGMHFPVHDLFVRSDGDGVFVINTLEDVSALSDGWERETLYLLYLDEAGDLSVVGAWDYATMVREANLGREATQPAPVQIPRLLGPNETFPEKIMGDWKGKRHGVTVKIGEKSLTIDGAEVDIQAARLLDRPLPPIRCSVYLEIDSELAARSNPNGYPTIAIMYSDEMPDRLSIAGPLAGPESSFIRD